MGEPVGFAIGALEGPDVGRKEGEPVGFATGALEGLDVGPEEGVPVGATAGDREGLPVGLSVAPCVGSMLGTPLGDGVAGGRMHKPHDMGHETSSGVAPLPRLYKRISQRSLFRLSHFPTIASSLSTCLGLHLGSEGEAVGLPVGFAMPHAPHSMGHMLNIWSYSHAFVLSSASLRSWSQIRLFVTLALRSDSSHSLRVGALVGKTWWGTQSGPRWAPRLRVRMMGYVLARTKGQARVMSLERRSGLATSIRNT